MKRRIGKKWFRVFSFDVETHADDESVRKKETGVWLASFIDEASKPYDADNFYTNLDDWLDRLSDETSIKCTHEGYRIPNLLIYAWNTAFEWSFILPVLLRRGFRWVERIGSKDEKVFSSVTTKTCSSVWQASIKIHKDGGIILLRDLMKIFSGSLRSVARSFNLPTQKGDLDYKKNRNFPGYEPTLAEKLYNFKDTKIVMDILEIMDKRDDRDFWQSMSAAGYSARVMLRKAFPRSFKVLETYREIYPELGREESQFLRKATSGGITYAPRSWQFKEIKGDIGHIDAHQMHPTQMATKFFPYGRGTYFKGRAPENFKGRSIKCHHVRVSYSSVVLHSVISLIGVEMIDDLDLYLWDFEIPTFLKCYRDAEIEYIDGYAYHVKKLPWGKVCLDNYRKRLEAKKKKDHFLIAYYKLLNNSFYGKLLERYHEYVFENYIREDGEIDSNPHEPESEKGDGVNCKYTYLPVGAAIPAYSRVQLIETAFIISPDGSKILYFDTDSIFFLKDEETMANVKKLNFEDNLGGWGWEPDITKAQFTAPKRYKLSTIAGEGEGFLLLKDDIKMAGVTLTGKEIFEEVDILRGIFSSHSRQRVRGGTMILDSKKALDIQAKYMDIYLENVENLEEGR